MGKLVQVNAGYSDVALPPQWLPFNAGQQTTLTNAEYSALGASTAAAVSVLSSPADPARPVISNPVSLADAVTQANNYTNAQLASAETGLVSTVFGRGGAVIAVSGDYTADQIADGTANRLYTAAEKTKLAGIATGATAVTVGATGAGAGVALSSTDPFLQKWSRTLDLRLPPVSLSSGTWTNLSYAASYSTTGATTTPYTETWVTDVSAGTWNFTIAALLAPNGAKVSYDYSFDGTTWVNFGTNIDTYTTTSTSLGFTTATAVVVTTQTKLFIRVTGTGTRNASNTTGYYALMNSFQAQRTA